MPGLGDEVGVGAELLWGSRGSPPWGGSEGGHWVTPVLLVSAALIPEPGEAMDAVYEELDYTVMPEYQKASSLPGWCMCPRTGTALPHGPSTAPGPGAVAPAHPMACWCPVSHCVPLCPLPTRLPNRGLRDEAALLHCRGCGGE